jgi:phage shock protein PspC (stress-responsive transcriptional regulator)
MTKKLFRSRKHKIIGGVAGGIAEYFDLDPVIVRALFIISSIGWGIGVLAYIVLWVITPLRTLEPIGYSPEGYPIGREMDEAPEPSEEEIKEIKADKAYITKRKTVFGIALIAIGILNLLSRYIPNFEFEDWWPLALIALGAYFLAGAVNFKGKSSEDTITIDSSTNEKRDDEN